MGPPLSTWPYADTVQVKKVVSENLDSEKCLRQNVATIPCTMTSYVNLRVISINLTFALIMLQVFLGLSSVCAGPVILNMDYLQGPVPLARNIRHLPCISRRTGQEGLCMFAIDCLKANGSHLGTCIDRFYFGSCCQIQDKTVLPQIIGNNIDDNTIDSASFVHPQTEDKFHTTVSKFPTTIYEKPERTTQKTATEKIEEKTESVETKSDEQTTIDNKIPDEDVKTTTNVETTTKVQTSKATTEAPIKLSTFQTVSNDLISTEKPISDDLPIKVTTTNQPSTIKPSTKPQVTRKPIKPTFKPRPTRPSNFTKPTITNKPRPTRPASIYNTTRKPPYRPPPKIPSTKKPLPSPPRLNITILPQSTSSRPAFTRPSIPSITYINTTVSNIEEITVTTLKSTPSTIISTEPATSSTSTSSSTSTAIPTSNVISILNSSTTSTPQTTPDNVTASLTPAEEVTEKILERITTVSSSETSASEVSIITSVETTTQRIENTTANRETNPDTVTSSTFPPLVTWSNTVDVVTAKPTENATQTSEDIWSPITPPEGWILISTIPPKADTPSSSTTTTSTTTTTTTTTTTEGTTTSAESLTTIQTTDEIENETIEIKTTQEPTTEALTTAENLTSMEPSTATQLSTSPVSTASTGPLSSTAPSTSTASSVSTESSTSTQMSISSTMKATEMTSPPIQEFTVNVTLSPTVPTSTSSVGLTTFTSVVSDNVTETTTVANETSSNVTTVSSTSAEQSSTLSPVNVTSSTTEIVTSTTSEPLNMSNYKEVCGRRLWPEARIVGGSKSGFGQWPWQISLRQYRTSTYLHKCGAALLNENWAITAAHCVEQVPPSELLVRLGEYDLANEDEPYGFAERRVQIVASHPHFDPATFEYDLALLRFYEPVTFQPNILPVCVPDNDDDYVGMTAHVTGWGRLYDEGPLPSVLQEVEVPVINNTACESMYQAAGYNEHIPHIFICAGRRKGGADSCEGDSGGPMVLERRRDGRFVLGGVISWGIGCAEPNQPGVYTRISEFRDWINQILQF